MRVKSVPRHLPRRDSAPGFLKVKRSIISSDHLMDKKAENKFSTHVRTVNFTNYCDMVHGMDLTVCEQNPTNTNGNSLEEWRSYSMSNETEAVDLSKSSGVTRSLADSSSENKKFKDTYLYQIMTDPNFLNKIAREKQASRSICPYCKKEFSSESEVKKHLNVQADNANQLTCCACGKSFAQKRYLRYHQRCHSERNKFACDICTRKYSRLDNLTRHNIFHTNPDKFPCNSCERTFARKDLLNKHLKCHENKYKFHCSQCQKYFKGPISLENHMKVFHSEAEAN